MSKRSRSRNAPRRQIIQERSNPAREQEILGANAQDYFSHHPMVKELLLKLPTATEVEARNIGLVLQQIIRGPASLLSNEADPAVSEEISRIRSKAVEVQKVSEEFENDQVGFLENVFESADRIMPQGAKRDQVIAQGVQQYKSAKQGAVANRAIRLMEFHKRLQNEPQEMIHIVCEHAIIGGANVQVPVEIRLLDRKWVYGEGDHMVPALVAERWREIQARRGEIVERKQVSLATRSTDKTHDELEMNNQRIDKKYHMKRARVALIGDEV